VTATATLEPSIEHDLLNRLQRQGMTRGAAQDITDLLPPAGRYEMVTELRDNPNALRELGHTWPGHLAERFRITYIAADEIRAQLLQGATR